MQVPQSLKLRLTKALFHPWKNPIDWELWDNVHTSVVFADFFTRESEPSPILKDIIGAFKRSEDYTFLIRTAYIPDKVILEGIVEILRNKQVSYQWFPIKEKRFLIWKEQGAEVVFHCGDLDIIYQTLPWFPGPFFFDIAVILKERLMEAKKYFIEDKDKYSYQILYKIVELSHCVFRSTGDGKEIEILSLILPFQDIRETIEGIAKKYGIQFEIDKEETSPRWWNWGRM